MALFMGVHKLSADVTPEKMKEIWTHYCAKCREKSLTPVQVIFSAEKGFANCYTQANSADEVRAVHGQEGIGLDDVVEVIQLTPR